MGDPDSGEYFFPQTGTVLQEEELLVNVPLPQGTDSATYLAKFDRHIMPAVRRFQPDLIIVSCGFECVRPAPSASRSHAFRQHPPSCPAKPPALLSHLRHPPARR